MSVQKTIGEAMRAARCEAGIRQNKLAECSGVKAGLISDYERGMRYPTLLTLISLADTLGISIDEYIGHTPPKKPKGRKYFGCF